MGQSHGTVTIIEHNTHNNTGDHEQHITHIHTQPSHCPLNSTQQ